MQRAAHLYLVVLLVGCIGSRPRLEPGSVHAPTAQATDPVSQANRLVMLLSMRTPLQAGGAVAVEAAEPISEPGRSLQLALTTRLQRESRIVLVPAEKATYRLILRDAQTTGLLTTLVRTSDGAVVWSDESD